MVGKNGISSNKSNSKSNEDGNDNMDSVVSPIRSIEDPSKWKQLRVPSNILSKELIEYSTLEVQDQRQQAIDGNNDIEVEQILLDRVERRDQWYFLKESQLKNEVTYGIKLAFPQESHLMILIIAVGGGGGGGGVASSMED
ncbi:hypothetical protein BGZ76_011753 [Entomortierella beljakovae]|nr:hypothetical protein BGZ76_011753 [Entomortierella beljakovae]